eukprot:8426-Heterococcus_DN1.PRE.1
MPHQGLTPDATSFNSTIDACSKGGQWQKAVEVLHEMQEQGLKPDVTSYNTTMDACSGSGQWQKATAILREMICAGVKPDIISYNRVINACQKGEQWQLTLDLLAELKAAGLQPNAVTYGCVIDASHAAKEHQKVEELYLEMLQRGLTHYHWNSTPADKGMLDFHDFGIGMAAAAIRIVLRDMSYKLLNKSISSAVGAHVHDVNSDLHIITGHAMHRDHRVGSALQPVIINLLKQQGIDCHVNSDNKGRLLVKASELQKYVATATSRK